MRTPFNPRFLIIGVLVSVSLISCGGGRMYLNEEADLGFYQRVGVVPFANLSADRNASDKVTATFANELLMLNTVAVANAGDFTASVSAIVKRDLLNPLEDLTSEETAAIGQATEVEGIFVGAVKDYGMVRSGQEEFPLVSVVVQFLDCQTGRVVWSYEVTKKGGPKFPIFSFGETHTLGVMTTKVCREVARSFGSVMR